MELNKFYKFDTDPPGILWRIEFLDHLPDAYCEKHKVPLDYEAYHSNDEVFCPVDRETFQFANPRYEQQKRLASALGARSSIKDFPVVRIDSEGVDVVAKERLNLVEEYWIEGKLTDTAKGIQAMIQFGRRDGSGEKVQVFVDPGHERVGFDSNDKDRHPAGIFSELKVTFKDSVTAIEPSAEEEKPA